MPLGGNSNDTTYTLVNPSNDWRAFDRLPKHVREAATEFMFDYSSEQIAQVWFDICYQDFEYFMKFMRTSDKQTVLETKKLWPNPTARNTTAYERAIARINKGGEIA